MIRPATLADAEAIRELVTPYFAGYALRPDQGKVDVLLVSAISSARHFCWVVEDEAKRVRGVLLALTGDNLWAQRMNSNVLAWISEIPGEGAALLRQFARWARSRPVIKVAGMSPDTDMDWRAMALAERIGFKRHGGAYLLYS